MKNFRFRLEPILQLRSAAAEQRRREVASAQNELDLHRRAEAEAEHRSGEAGRDAHGRLARGASALEARAAFGHAKIVRAASRAARDRRDQAERQLSAAREHLVSAWRELRSFERLRSRALSAHRVESARYEARELDDVARRKRAEREDSR